MFNTIKKYTSLVFFSHTLFAMPFALISFTLASQSKVPRSLWLLLVQVIVCMVTARNSAMSFNRYVDRFIDAQNPRTKERELPAGKLLPKSVFLFFLVNTALFMGCAFSINILCFYLTIPALAVLCGYSYTKRFTWLSHFVLGLSLAIAPAGAFIAVTATLSLSVVLLSVMVVLWVSGFDILYALSDEQHDKAYCLFSIPQRFGQKRSLLISTGIHITLLPMLVLFGIFAHLGAIYWVATALFTTLLAYQHLIVTPNDISKLNRAFFTANGTASVLFAALTITDILLW